jgi:catechol 2,3-dioxygenase-like lactoylglutathione lyase family enzyme
VTALPLSGDNELARGQVARRLPCQDPARARTWYADKLGLHPVEERPGGLRYRCGDTMFALFASAGAPSGQHTQMGWKVADLDAAVAEMRARRRRLRGVRRARPAHGRRHRRDRRERLLRRLRRRAAWFHDSEGNLLGLGPPFP